MRKCALWFFPLLCLGLLPMAYAADTGGQAPELMLFQELPNVVSATLKSQKAADAPAAISVVTAQQIKQRGYRTLKEMMNDLPGWSDMSDTNENTVGIRGVFASTTNTILIMINGHRMNDLSLGRWNTDQFLGVDIIDHVEFVRGPASVLYGTGALVGVVNIITKKGADVDGLYIRPEVRSYREGGTDYGANLTWGKKITDKGTDYNMLLNFTYLDAAGADIAEPAKYDVLPSPAGGRTKKDGNLYWEKLPKNYSSFASLDSGNLSMDMRADHSDRAIPGETASAGGGFYNYYAEPIKPLYEEDTFYANLKYLHKLTDKSSLTFNPSYHHFLLNELTFFNSFGANQYPPLGTRAGQLSEESHIQLQVYYNNQLMDNLSILVGVDGLLSDFGVSYSIASPAASDPNFGNQIKVIPDRHDSALWFLGGYLGQVIYAPVDKVEITVSGRYDTFQNIAKPRFTPRAGVVYKPLEGLVAKLLYGQSYLSPQWEHVRSSTVGNAFLANPNLSPEDFEGYDAILEYVWQKLDLELDLFKDRTNGIISAGSIGGISTYKNLGERDFQGFEANAKYSLMSMAALQAGYSFIKNSGGTTESALLNNEIVDYPTSIFRYGVQIFPMKDLTLEVQGRRYSSVRAANPITKDTTIPYWNTVDFSANYKWAPLDVQFIVNNLADDRYTVAGTSPIPFPRPGRNFQVSVGTMF